MSIQTIPEACAVIGNPIAHSRSPEIHGYFARQFEHHLIYERILCTSDNFANTVKDHFRAGGKGLNITTPFKQLAFDLADVRLPAAEQAASGNTLWLENDLLHVTSTDGAGWYEHTQSLDIDLVAKDILILGAGGAGRVILEYLRNLDSANSIVIANRSVDKLQALNLSGKTKGVSLDNIPSINFDLVINALPIGWQSTFPNLKLQITDQTLAYDLNYDKGADAYREWFTTRGGLLANFHDGWGMLVCQAALSYAIWFGVKPQTTTLIAEPALLSATE